MKLAYSWVMPGKHIKEISDKNFSVLQLPVPNDLVMEEGLKQIRAQSLRPSHKAIFSFYFATVLIASINLLKSSGNTSPMFPMRKVSA